MLVRNPKASRIPYPQDLRDLMSIAKARESRRWLSTWSGINARPTPLRQLPGLAQKFGVARIWVKDESERSPLGSFKVLGAPIALVRLILRRVPGLLAEEVFSGRHASALA